MAGVGEGPVTILGLPGGRINCEARAGAEGEGMDTFFHVNDAVIFGICIRPHVPDGVHIFDISAVFHASACAVVEGGVEGDVVITCYHELELCLVRFEEGEGFVVFSGVADIC